MNQVLVLIIITLLGTGPQRNVDTEKLKLQSQELADATLNGDYARAADLTFPKLVTLMGGRRQYIATLARSMAETNSPRFRITAVTAGEPHDIIEVDRQHYAIVPTTTRIKVPEGMLVGESFMIGVSNDGGRNWTFVESGGATKQKQKLRTLLGAAADQLRLPEVKRPTLYRGAIQN